MRYLSHTRLLLWASDRPVAETSTWQHITQETDIHAPAGIRTRYPSSWAATDANLRLRGNLGSAVSDISVAWISTTPWRRTANGGNGGNCGTLRNPRGNGWIRYERGFVMEPRLPSPSSVTEFITGLCTMQLDNGCLVRTFSIDKASKGWRSAVATKHCFALHLLQNGHAGGPFDSITGVIHSSLKGLHLDTLRRVLRCQRV